MHRKPTMSDVARLAGVGAMTVSRVLSGAAHVREDRARRVQVAIQQLNYQPNELARAFRGQRMRFIGLILPYLYDPFFATCAHAVSAVAREKGYLLSTTTSNEDPEAECNEVSQMLQHHVEGLLLIPTVCGQSRITRSMLEKTPLVAFDRPLSDDSIDCVLVQNQSGSRRMVGHLIEHGHTSIAFMGMSRKTFTTRARFDGYRGAMKNAGLEVNGFFRCQTPESTLDAVRSIMHASNRPTAFFTANTMASRYVFSALLQLGVNIPGEAALACFDDFEMAELTAPPLSVVRQPAQEMGRVAARLLFERLERGVVPRTGKRVVLPVEIVLRRSCGCENKTVVAKG